VGRAGPQTQFEDRVNNQFPEIAFCNSHVTARYGNLPTSGRPNVGSSQKRRTGSRTFAGAKCQLLQSAGHQRWPEFFPGGRKIRPGTGHTADVGDAADRDDAAYSGSREALQPPPPPPKQRGRPSNAELAAKPAVDVIAQAKARIAKMLAQLPARSSLRSLLAAPLSAAERRNSHRE
jgi:hypothetical protein